ncbi:N-acetyltransferase [Rhizobium sp. LCM 4573]|uniref:GNAT family N-acetyltransferase n=1 Tax=Rhizobium sp. LCM 4573 TaxID=1848291 RepID=UPI0009F2FFCD|nr:GNAT family N-acetyltransferase [Rhizobium sp. LCM 4573]
MRIERVERISASDIADCDFSFDVTSELKAPWDPFLDTRDVEAYAKTYEFDEDEATANEDRAVIAILDAGRVRGHVIVSKSWNGYAEIDDIQIDRPLRGAGLGRRLMDHAVKWAKARDLPGIRLETQSNNVAACRFYKKYGFELGGYDEHLYSALGQSRRETALFWYLFFKKITGGALLHRPPLVWRLIRPAGFLPWWSPRKPSPPPRPGRRRRRNTPPRRPCSARR